jgi:hypothetical protein
MLAFYREYKELAFLPSAVAKKETTAEDEAILPLPVAKLPANPGQCGIHDCVLLLPWAHNVVLLGIKDRETRIWYMEQALEHGWS